MQSLFSSRDPQVSCINIEHIHQLVTTFCVDPCNPLSIPEYMERTADNPISSSFPTESSSGRLLPDQKRHAVSAMLYTLSISCQIQLFGRPIPGALLEWNRIIYDDVTCEGWITPRLMIPNFVSGSILFVCFYLPGVGVTERCWKTPIR